MHVLGDGHDGFPEIAGTRQQVRESLAWRTVGKSMKCRTMEVRISDDHALADLAEGEAEIERYGGLPFERKRAGHENPSQGRLIPEHLQLHPEASERVDEQVVVLLVRLVLVPVGPDDHPWRLHIRVRTQPTHIASVP